MKPSKQLGVLLITGIAGWLTGGWIGKKPSTTDAVPEPNSLSRTHSTGHASKTERPEPKRDFATLLKNLSRTGLRTTAEGELIARSSTGDLRKILVSLSQQKSDWRDYSISHDRFLAMQAVGRELWLRDGNESLRWAEATGSEEMIVSVLTEAIRQNPGAALELGRGFYPEFGTPMNDLMEAAVRSAALKSSADLLDVEKYFGNSSGSSGFEGFAENFDFRSYLSQTPSMYGFDEGIRYWSALDPEAAAAALRDRIGEKSGHFTGTYAQAFEGRAEMASDEDAARWIGGVIAGVPPENRKLDVVELASRNIKSESRINALIDNMPDDQDRVTILSTLLASSTLDANSLAVRALAAAKSDDLRFQALSEWLQNRNINPQRSLPDLDQVFSKLTLSVAQQNKLRSLIPPKAE